LGYSAIDQIAQFGLSSLKVIYYSEQLFRGPNTSGGYYDKEDGVLYTFNSTSNQEEEEKEFSVELDLSFEIDEDEFINDEFYLHVKGLSAGIEFCVEENSWEDYM